MPEVLDDLSTANLVTAIEENSFAFNQIFGHCKKVEVYDGPELLSVLSGIRLSFTNAVMRARLSTQRVESAIREVVARARERQVPRLWNIGPSTRPRDLGRQLEAHGFRHTGDNPGMAVDLQALVEDLPAPQSLIVERVEEPRPLEAWNHAFCTGFGIPLSEEGKLAEIWMEVGPHAGHDLRHYLGWLAGRPVATAAMFLGAGVAGIYSVATVPDARRLGIGSRMTLAPLREARQEGYRVGILHSSQMGLGVYRRLGFEQYCTINLYVWQGE